MSCYKLEIFLLFVMQLIVCSVEDYCPQTNTPSSTRYFNLADKTESMYTGSLSESNFAFKEEYSDYCPDAASRKYRTINGTCNNRKNLGASFTPQSRVLPPAYNDGVNSPRQYGVDGLLLPSARNISLHLHPANNAYSNLTLMMVAFGQFLDHDLVSTPVATRANSTIKCCITKDECTPYPLDPDCFPILLPEDEYLFPGTCLEFVRSLAATDSRGAQLRPRQQLNSVTSFLDGSPIYGSTNDVAQAIRDPGGYLLSTKDNQFLPEAQKSGCIKRNGTNDYCFMAGDSRVNQHPYLGAMHTLWVREHNRIARQLRIFRPDLPNEEIHQISRKIVIARIQAITYNTWLPIVLGDDVDRWKLRSIYGRCDYNEDVDPRISTSFSAAAFRFGHSTVPMYFPIGDKQYMLRYLFNRDKNLFNTMSHRVRMWPDFIQRITNSMALRPYLLPSFSPSEVYYNYENVLIGMTGITKAKHKSIQPADKFFAYDLSRFLFLNNGTGKSLDLVTVNIQRGRDQGIPPYVKWRAFCGLRPLTGFNDTEALGPFVKELEKMYRSIEDIDLYTGIVHEPVDTGMVGPTGRCLIIKQFQKLKYGDRFFFDNNEKNSRFTDAQLMALRRTTFSEVMCLNSYLNHLPVDVFRFHGVDNPLVPCAQLRREGLKLSLFA